MRERNGGKVTRMIRTVVVAFVCALAFELAPASAAPVSDGAWAMTEFSSQARSRPRLRVRPGRLLYRECDFRLVQQARPDGTFIVPRQRCWWVRG